LEEIEHCIVCDDAVDAGLAGGVFGAPRIKEGFPLLDNLKSKPAMLTVGMKDGTIAPDVQLADFRTVWPGRPIIKLPNARHFGQEDEPDAIIALIEQFILRKGAEAKEACFRRVTKARFLEGCRLRKLIGSFCAAHRTREWPYELPAKACRKLLHPP
jgi:hypothetical protein